MKPPPTSIIGEQLGVLTFFDLQGAGLACAESEFDQEELFSRVIKHVRDNDPKVSLAASKQFWGMMKDLVVLHGQVATQERTTIGADEHGQLVRQVQSTRSLLAGLRAERSKPGPAIGPEFIGPRDPSTLALPDPPEPTEPREPGIPVAFPDQPDPAHPGGVEPPLPGPGGGTGNPGSAGGD